MGGNIDETWRDFPDYKKSTFGVPKKGYGKKPFQKITVSELIQECNINRKTFYYHFEDIYALLKWTFEKEAIEVVKHFNLLVDYEEAIAFIMDYVDQNRYMLNCAYDSIGRDELRRFLFADCHEITISIINYAEKEVGKNLEPEYKEFLGLFYSEAIAGIILIGSWIQTVGIAKQVFNTFQIQS